MSKRLGMLTPGGGGGLGTYFGDVNIGGCRFGDRYGYMGDVHIMGGEGVLGQILDMLTL